MFVLLTVYTDDWFLIKSFVIHKFTGGNDKIVVLNKTTLCFKRKQRFILKLLLKIINSGNLII